MFGVVDEADAGNDIDVFEDAVEAFCCAGVKVG